MISELLDRGTVDVIDRVRLTARLERGERLRVKLGIDPTGTDLHLGHAVVLRKLRQFQKYGHHVILIIGDWTARIGDPSGRKETRPPLTAAQVKQNAQSYLTQISSIIDLNQVEVRMQSEWFDAFTLQTVIELAGKFTVQQLTQREDFKARLAAGIDVRYHEPMYCLLQGYDSVPIKADVELGGNDQLFNLLKGREVQEIYGVTPQDVLTVPLLIGLDGTQKMGKSLNNYIAISDTAGDMYGKIMSLPDQLIVQYFTLATDIPLMELREIEEMLHRGKANPRDMKARLAREVVTLYYSTNKAAEVEEEFNRVFRSGEMPHSIREMPLTKNPARLDELLVAAELAESKSEAQRLIAQGGVQVAGVVVQDWKKEIALHDGDVIQVGKRKFVRVKLADVLK